MRSVFIIAFTVFSFALKSQTKNHHVIGLNADYSTLPGIVGSHIGTNFTYIYSYEKLFTKLELGLMPKSNFGQVFKTCLTVGLTTNINQPISFHTSIGIGGLTPSKLYNYDNDEYDFYSGPYCGDLGILVRPTKNEKFSIGLDFMTNHYEVYPLGDVTVGKYNLKSKNGFLFFFNCSVNFKLNGKSASNS